MQSTLRLIYTSRINRDLDGPKRVCVRKLKRRSHRKYYSSEKMQCSCCLLPFRHRIECEITVGRWN